MHPVKLGLEKSPYIVRNLDESRASSQTNCEVKFKCRFLAFRNYNRYTIKLHNAISDRLRMVIYSSKGLRHGV